MRIIRPIARVLVVMAAVFLFCHCAASAVFPRFAFVANTSDDTVSIYTVDGTSGFLRDNGYVVVGKKPAGVTVTPSGAFLYVANSGGGNVSAFSVNLSNGSLTAVTGSPFAAKTGPTTAATDPAGKFLFVANKTSGDISAYTINGGTGALTVVSGSPFTAGTSPVALQVDPSGKFLYVANSGSGNISAFTINSSNGALTNVSGSPFTAGTTPEGLSVTPSGKFVYVANGGSGNVSGYTLNASSGMLAAVSGSPFAAGTKPSAVAVDPSSKFVYVANSGSNNVSEFSLSATTGALKAISGSPVISGTAPASITVDSSGKFVFTGNTTSGDVSGFALSSSTGALTALVPGPVRTRKGPASLAISSGKTAITYTPSYNFVADFEGGVPVLSVNASSGALKAVKGSPFGAGSPRSIAVSPNGQFIYTANNDSSNTIGEYTVDAATGALTSIGTIANGDTPYSVVVDPSNRFVYAVAIDTNGVYAYTIDAKTGGLALIKGSPFGAADAVAPDRVAVDPTGRFLMVGEACCAGNAGISVFNINTASGKLTVVKGSPFLPPVSDSEPSSVVVDPTGRFIYSANGGSFGDTGVVVYSLNATTGKLTLVGTIVPGGLAPWGITTDVTGSDVYLTSNDSSIYGYAIDNSTGELTNISGSPFLVPSGASRGIAVDPSGKFLYLANAEQVIGYKITTSNGKLTVLSSSPYSAGESPLDLTVGGTIK